MIRFFIDNKIIFCPIEFTEATSRTMPDVKSFTGDYNSGIYEALRLVPQGKIWWKSSGVNSSLTSFLVKKSNLS